MTTKDPAEGGILDSHDVRKKVGLIHKTLKEKCGLVLERKKRRLKVERKGGNTSPLKI